MKIAIDISPLNSDHKFRGIGAYTENLINAMKAKKAPGFSLQLVKKGEISQDCDLVHYPYFDFFWTTLPLKKKLPMVVTIHDVIPLVFPDKFPKGIKGWLKFQIQKFALRSVAAVITDSENSKNDIVKHLGFPKEKIFVIPLAPGGEFKPIKSTKLLNRNIVKYNLPEKFVLYTGDVNWNKNVEGLIKAFSRIQRYKRSLNSLRGYKDIKIQKLELVLAGKAFEDKKLKETRSIFQLIKKLGLTNQVKILGYVPIKDLVVIYNLAMIYCQPSFYEGFGLPVLEAMACGTPVICSQASSLSEVAGKAAFFINPNDYDSIAQGIERLIKDKELSKALEQKGLEQVRKFSWEKTAGETMKVYEDALVKA